MILCNKHSIFSIVLTQQNIWLIVTYISSFIIEFYSSYSNYFLFIIPPVGRSDPSNMIISCKLKEKSWNSCSISHTSVVNHWWLNWLLTASTEQQRADVPSWRQPNQAIRSVLFFHKGQLHVILLKWTRTVLNQVPVK